MANRAYLYFADDVSSLTYKQRYLKSDRSERLYLDSRHQLPLAWFLFYRPEHVRLVPDPENNWNDVYFVRDWESAWTDFSCRVPLLLIWFKNEFSYADIETFSGWLQSLRAHPEENFLVLDPGELEIQEIHAPALRSALQALEDTTLEAQAKFERLDQWSNCKHSYRFLTLFDLVFGICYGGYHEK